MLIVATDDVQKCFTVVCGEMLTTFSKKTLHTIVWKIEILREKPVNKYTKICQSSLVVGLQIQVSPTVLYISDFMDFP